MYTLRFLLIWTFVMRVECNKHKYFKYVLNLSIDGSSVNFARVTIELQPMVAKPDNCDGAIHKWLLVNLDRLCRLYNILYSFRLELIVIFVPWFLR